MKTMDGETSQQYDNEVKSSFDKSTIIPGSETISGITIGNEQNSLTQYWHGRTIILLFLGIMASYCCVFTVGMTSPLIMKDLNLNESQLAYILTVARSVRIFPKLFSGLIVDIFGGRNMFLLSHLLTCLFTLLFSYGHSVNYLALMWTGNNISTTLAWPALVKVSSKWFSYKILGNVMSILSLSYLFGDAIAKLYLSGFIYFGVGWRTLFHVAFLTLFTFVLIGQWGLRASPKDVGLVEPEVDPSNVFGSAGNSDEFMGFRKSLAPLVFNLPFWLLVLQSGGLNMMIYVCNDWLSLYLKQRCQATDFVSVLSTILFPVAGGFSALLIGQLFDRFSIRGRNIMMILFHVGTCLVTVLMYLANLGQAPASQFTTMLLFTLLGLTVTGPYTLPSGVLAIKFGGKKIAATMVGIIDAVGTVASLLSAILGSTFLNKHNLPVEERWGNIFFAMFLDALFVMTLSVAYMLVDRPETNKEKK